MKENMRPNQQKVAMAVGSAAAAAAIFAPLRYKWKGVLSAVAAGGLISGLTGFSLFKKVMGLH